MYIRIESEALSVLENLATLHCTRLRYIAPPYITLHYTRLTRPITPLQFHCKCVTLITLHGIYNSTTLQPQLHYTTLNSAVVGEMTTATIAATPTNTNATSFRSISGFPLPSVIHNNQPLLWVSYSETSAAALCGTTDRNGIESTRAETFHSWYEEHAGECKWGCGCRELIKITRAFFHLINFEMQKLHIDLLEFGKLLHGTPKSANWTPG